MAADFPIRIQEGLEQQMISLFRSFLELSDGKVDCRQHDFGMDYTTSQNASLCASFLGISCSRQFGRFDPEEMQAALSKSKLFAEQSKPDIPNTLDWGLHIMAYVPVGFPDNYLVQCYQSWGWRTLIMAQNLPSQLLCGFSARQVDQIRFHL